MLALLGVFRFSCDVIWGRAASLVGDFGPSCLVDCLESVGSSTFHNRIDLPGL
jgi:hypothetical protein